MRIMGIDPSLTGTGVVTIKDGRIEDKQLIKTKPTGDDKVKELGRLMKIRDDIYMRSDIRLAVIEGLAFSARNTTALVQLSALNYFIRERLLLRGTPFVICQATTLKKFATGHGNAHKDQIILSVYKRWGFSPENSDICDAYVLAKIGEAMLDLKGKYTKEQSECLELLRKQLKNGPIL